MTTYIRIETHTDANEFADFLRLKNVIPNRGPYYRTEYLSAIPCYYILNADTYEYKGWQPLCSLRSNSINDQKYFKIYNTAIPSYAFVHPELYPEYFI